MPASPADRTTFTGDATEASGDGSAPLAESASDAVIEPGTMIGEYRVEGLLGEGTFGHVYAGEQPVIGKRVAIKLLRRKLSSNAEVVARFVAEARAINRVRHRNIVDVFSFGTLGDRHYYVMERLDGITLGRLLDRHKRLGPDQALPILRGIAAALDAAHEASVVHRDLKPDNVFLVEERDGSHTPKLLDFGVAKLLTDDMGVKTATGVAMGTPRYMSPEQCRGKTVDHRSDIYALGAVAHEMLTGRPPFEAGTPVELLLKHTMEPPPTMSSVCADLPPELDAPVLAMLAKRPKDRPDSAGQAITELGERVRAASMINTLPLGTMPGTSAGAPAPLEKGASPRAAAPRASSPLARTVVLDVPGAQAPPPAAPAPTLVDAPTLVREVRAAAPRAEAAAARSLGPSPSIADSGMKLPRSNSGAITLGVGALVLAIIGTFAFIALRGNSPAPLPAASSEPRRSPATTATARAAESSAADEPSAAAESSAAPSATASAANAPRPAGISTGRAPVAKDPTARPSATARPKSHDIGF